MKNIHIIPTDKPSRLFKFANELHLDTIPKDYYKKYNIYITSDEEIKEGHYYYNERLNKVFQAIIKSGYNTVDKEFKIILTTDQDLIKDGVQAIDDEFLKWFVKNPSCDSLEVKKRYSDFTVDPFVGYKIIIPQEEPKQKYEYIGECKGNNDNGCFMDSSGHDCGCFTRISKEEPKFDDSIENSLSIMSIANDMFGKKEELKQELLPDFKITKNIFDFVTDLSDTNKEEPKQDPTLENAKLALRKYILTNKEKVTEDLQEMRKKSGNGRYETLEEASEMFISKYYSGEGYERDIEEAIKFGAKWMEEEMEKLRDFETWKEWKNNDLKDK
jgi:hypothetical protein